MNASNSHPDFKFSTSEGHQLTRSVLRPLLPYDPHDDQLEGVCKMADGVDLMALTRTGLGNIPVGWIGWFCMIQKLPSGCPVLEGSGLCFM